jgi:serine/threonine-protein kinase ATR
MSILQLCFKDPPLRRQTLLLWQALTITLVLDDIKPILAQTTAAFVQAWPSLTETERVLVHSILSHCLNRPKKELGIAIYNIADFTGIKELEPLYKVVANAVEQHSFDQHITGFLERLDTFDETVQMQALRELVGFLKEHTTQIYSLASGSSFAPSLGQLVHGLLQSSIRNAGSKSSARSLALRALGMVGALDPDRTTFPNEAAPFVLQHDLRDANECVQFCIYTLEKVLVKALRSTNDPDQQNGLFVAIKGLAQVCGYDEKSRNNHAFHTGVEASVRERWNKISLPAREIIDHLISTMIQVAQPAREELTYPLFTHTSHYREWLQSWTSDLIHQLVNDPSQRSSTATSAKAIFSPFRAAVRRGHDLTVALFVLPYLVFFTITSGNAKMTDLIAKEIHAILQDQIAPLPSKMTSDSRSLCAQVNFVN